jgi:hypothetical protein
MMFMPGLRSFLSSLQAVAILNGLPRLSMEMLERQYGTDQGNTQQVSL